MLRPAEVLRTMGSHLPFLRDNPFSSELQLQRTHHMEMDGTRSFVQENRRHLKGPCYPLPMLHESE